MQFARVDANDGTIFCMQSTEVKSVLAAEDDVIVELIPSI